MPEPTTDVPPDPTVIQICVSNDVAGHNLFYTIICEYSISLSDEQEQENLFAQVPGEVRYFICRCEKPSPEGTVMLKRIVFRDAVITQGPNSQSLGIAVYDSAKGEIQCGKLQKFKVAGVGGSATVTKEVAEQMTLPGAQVRKRR